SACNLRSSPCATANTDTALRTNDFAAIRDAHSALHAPCRKRRFRQQNHTVRSGPPGAADARTGRICRSDGQITGKPRRKESWFLETALRSAGAGSARRPRAQAVFVEAAGLRTGKK